jgi:hypothetical protein
MSKVSIRPRAHNRKAEVRNHYEALRRPDLEMHPVDSVVQARLEHSAVRRRVRQLQERVMKALGSDTQPFLQLDALLNDERGEREEAYFNVGYEYGSNAVRHRVLREMVPGAWPKRLAQVAARLNDEVLQAGLTSPETLLVFVESLWVLAVRAPSAETE